MHQLPKTGGRHKRDPKKGHLSVQQKPTRPADPPLPTGPAVVGTGTTETAVSETAADTKGDKA
ncbi:MAG: hypothetical protein ACRBBS_09840 [Thalassovita sp.]